MQDVIWSGRPKLRKPVMVCAFKGWNDAGEVLEEAVQLLHVAVGDGQEVGGVGGAGLGTPDRAQLDLKLVAEALGTPGDLHQVAPLELPAEEVGVAERARGNGPAAIAQLDRQVGRTALREQAVLAGAGEHALDLSSGT